MCACVRERTRRRENDDPTGRKVMLAACTLLARSMLERMRLQRLLECSEGVHAVPRREGTRAHKHTHTHTHTNNTGAGAGTGRDRDRDKDGTKTETEEETTTRNAHAQRKGYRELGDSELQIDAKNEKKEHNAQGLDRLHLHAARGAVSEVSIDEGGGRAR